MSSYDINFSGQFDMETMCIYIVHTHSTFSFKNTASNRGDPLCGSRPYSSLYIFFLVAVTPLGLS